VQALLCVRSSNRVRARHVACLATDGSQPADASAADESKRKKGFTLPKCLRPLTDFGVGKKSVWEGGVGLFLVFGTGAPFAVAAALDCYETAAIRIIWLVRVSGLCTGTGAPLEEADTDTLLSGQLGQCI
jgi:hypothetical protein